MGASYDFVGPCVDVGMLTLHLLTKYDLMLVATDRFLDLVPNTESSTTQEVFTRKIKTGVIFFVGCKNNQQDYNSRI